jgi:hypothetical protein
MKVTNTKHDLQNDGISFLSQILLVDYLEEKGVTITDSYYTPLLDEVQMEYCFSSTMPPHTWLPSQS